MIRRIILAGALAFLAGVLIPANGLLIVTALCIVAAVSLGRVEVQR